MKKTLLMAAVLVMAACGEKKAETPPADTTGNMAPAAAEPAMHDSTMADTTKMAAPTTPPMGNDSTMARDTATKPKAKAH